MVFMHIKYAIFLLSLLALGNPLPAAGQTQTASSGAGRSEEKSVTPYVNIRLPNRAKIGQPFQADISIVPASNKPVEIRMDPLGMKYSESRFTLSPGGRKFITSTVTDSLDGLAWVHGYASGYQDGWNSIDVGFLGHLKPNSTERLPYGHPTTLTLSLVDKEGNPFSSSSELALLVDSADAVLQSGNQQGSLRLKLSPGMSISPQFQVTPRNVQGGTIHLNTTLTISDQNFSLNSETFSIPTAAADWLPIVLAVAGGLLYGAYKILNSALPDQHRAWASTAIFLTSGVAGFIGYLIADLDLLGLKLDPTVLRSYPLLGFLVAYFGIDILVKNKIPPAD